CKRPVDSLSQRPVSLLIGNDFDAEWPVVARCFNRSKESGYIEASLAAQPAMIYCIFDQLSDRLRRRIRQFDVSKEATRYGGDFAVRNAAARHMPDVDQQSSVAFVGAGDDFDPGLDVRDI